MAALADAYIRRKRFEARLHWASSYLAGQQPTAMPATPAGAGPVGGRRVSDTGRVVNVVPAGTLLGMMGVKPPRA